jgi:hypothetical protein
LDHACAWFRFFFPFWRKGFIVYWGIRNGAGHRIEHGFQQTNNGAQLCGWKLLNEFVRLALLFVVGTIWHDVIPTKADSITLPFTRLRVHSVPRSSFAGRASWALLGSQLLPVKPLGYNPLLL